MEEVEIIIIQLNFFTYVYNEIYLILRYLIGSEKFYLITTVF